MDERNVGERQQEGGAECKPEASHAPASRRGRGRSSGTPNRPRALQERWPPLRTASEVAIAPRTSREAVRDGRALATDGGQPHTARDLPVTGSDSNANGTVDTLAEPCAGPAEPLRQDIHDVPASPRPAQVHGATSREPAILTVDELAALLRVNRKTVYDALSRGEIPGARRIGGRYRILRDAVLAGC